MVSIVIFKEGRLGEKMEQVIKLITAMALLIASMAVLIFSMSNATAFQTAAVSLGANPVVTFYCYGSTTYTVPTGTDLIVTDLSTSGSLTIQGDGSTRWVHYGSAGNTSKAHAFTTGVKFEAGEVIGCIGSEAYLSGYLVQG
jgi:hypothetical protein